MLLEHKVPQLMMSLGSEVVHKVAVEKTTQVTKTTQDSELPSSQQNGIVVNGNGLMNGHH